jgi:Tfp pilus assembly protein PilX
VNGREVTRVGSSSVNCNRECAERNECQVFGELNPSENSGMTDTVSHKTGAETVTKLTRQLRTVVTLLTVNLCPISGG